MTIERKVRMMAGFMILLSLTMYWFVCPHWLFLAAFVGLNLFQSSITGFCPAEILLKKAAARKTGA